MCSVSKNGFKFRVLDGVISAEVEEDGTDRWGYSIRRVVWRKVGRGDVIRAAAQMDKLFSGHYPATVECWARALVESGGHAFELPSGMPASSALWVAL